MTGSLITSNVNGHSKTKEGSVPAAAGSTRDMLSAGTDVGASGASPTQEEQWWNHQSALLLMMYQKAIS